jgi:hypothetical protein
MKLFVRNKKSNEPLYINVSVSSRYEFAVKYGSTFRLNDGFTYSIDDIYAESESGNTTAGMIIGGVLGLLAGPVGIVIGASLGGVVGNNNDETDKERVDNFNNSYGTKR